MIFMFVSKFMKFFVNVSVLSSCQKSHFPKLFSSLSATGSCFYGKNILRILQKPGFPDVPGVGDKLLTLRLTAVR